MRLRTKLLNVSTGGALIAVVHINDATSLNIKPLERVRIKHNSKDAVAIVDVAYNSRDVKVGEIGLFDQLAETLGCGSGVDVNVRYEKDPESVWFIRKKLEGARLNQKEIDQIVRDVISNSLTEVETSYFVAGSFVRGLNMDETLALTRAIVSNSERLRFSKKPILDKHSIGGICGNRTTMIVVPIIAAAGFIIPKTSTKSITSPSGTANTMEVLAPVEFSNKKIMEIIRKTNGCMVWGGTKGLASADDMFIKLEKPLSLDPEGFLLASILAKKSAVDASHVLIDIPIGKEAKINSREKAESLKNKFVKLGKMLGMNVKVIITDGSQPIGNGVGPSLEARDVLLVLQNKGPEDLKEKSIRMAGIMLDMVGVRNGERKAKEILESGLAFKKMKEIIKVQGGNPNVRADDIAVGKYKYEFKSRKNGRILEIRNKLISYLAKTCGAPASRGAGLYIHKKVGASVKRGDILVTLYADDKDRLNDAIELLGKDEIIIVK